MLAHNDRERTVDLGALFFYSMLRHRLRNLVQIRPNDPTSPVTFQNFIFDSWVAWPAFFQSCFRSLALSLNRELSGPAFVHELHKTVFVPLALCSELKTLLTFLSMSLARNFSFSFLQIGPPKEDAGRPTPGIHDLFGSS